MYLWLVPVFTEAPRETIRAAKAPSIRRIFSSSPKDPRYHMLEELSAKFRTSPQPSLHEPRAALILNRFSHNLYVLYATNAVSDILGLSPDEIRGKSFYECIQDDCRLDAIRVLESAKANDSIAYLRFRYLDPRLADAAAQNDQEMQDAVQSSDSEDGGVELHSNRDSSSNGPSTAAPVGTSNSSSDDAPRYSSAELLSPTKRTSSGGSSEMDHSGAVVFDEAPGARSSTSSLPLSARSRVGTSGPYSVEPVPEVIEIEAVISCTSDGLVAVLRRARPLVIDGQQVNASPQSAGVFAAPWGANPIRPHQFQPEDPRLQFRHGFSPNPEPARPSIEVGGPSQDSFMNAIRETAVFAWSLAGINGNIASYGRGIPRGEAQPPDGLPIWDPHAQPGNYMPPENQALQRWIHVDQRTSQFGHDHTLPYQFRWHQEQSLQYYPGYGVGPSQPLGHQPAYQGRFTQDYRNPGYDVYYNIYHNPNTQAAHSRDPSTFPQATPAGYGYQPNIHGQDNQGYGQMNFGYDEKNQGSGYGQMDGFRSYNLAGQVDENHDSGMQTPHSYDRGQGPNFGDGNMGGNPPWYQ
ncbi:hypothetical protein BP5796_02245 [Coleophoma crateriformis]|uniref:PAS domain-containing protein n=1 Tax=Coleophoma crateriformis TaxID=565419 RepID=A0A3D8SXU2_9HELO|nr:hypothetical protein BP5796_02245 [Coleophoma crateriformis]